MKTSKRLLAIISSIAIAASSFSALCLSASAKEEAYGPLTWEDETATGFSDSGRGASSIVTDFSGNTGNSVLMNNSGGTRGTVKNTFTSVSGGHIGISYDAYFTTNDTNRKYIAIGTSSLGRMSGDSVDTANTVFAVGNYDGGNVYINGSVDTGIAANQWITVNAIADFNTKTVDVTITQFGAETELYSGTVDFLDSTVTAVSGITLNSNRGVTDPAIYLDNFALSTYEEATITLAEETVTVETDSSSVIATVTGAETVEAVAEDDGVVEVSYDESTGEITASYVSSGKTTVKITATSVDGVSVYDSVDVISGSVELTTVDVKYVYYDDENTVTVKDGYTITDVPVNTVFTLADVEVEDVVLNSDYRYRNPAVENDSYTAVAGENVLNVVYADRDAAVSAITASYATTDASVADVPVEIGEGYYVGDEYTFISNNYVTDAEGVIYAVGNDYTEDTGATILNNASTPVNSVLRQTVTLSEETVVSYTVTESPNADFYSEWENVFGTTGFNYPTGRNIASGGKMITTESQVVFYTVPATGYYQIVVTGGPKNRGTAFYQTAELAAAATAFDDGTALLYNSLTGKENNNDQYGFYIVKTALLNEGDTLTVRGYGGSGKTTDNLDYVLVRRIVTGDIIGADGISIVPGGQSAEFTFDSGLDVAPVWSVTGVEGVTVDENGVVTVAENAAEGTATLTAAIESAGVEGSKEITIAKAAVTSFTFNGATAFSNGQDATYSVSEVKDQFGVDITDAVTATYASSDDNIVSIDETTGVATAKAVGEVELEVTVSVGDSSKSDSKTVTIKNYFLAGAATGDETAVDATALITSDNIIGYMVTTAKDGKEVSQKTVEEIPATVDTTGADSYEIAPVYKYTSVSLGTAFADSFADGMYNITFKKGDTKRADINVNGYMVGNNVDQYGEGRSISSGAEYTINDAVIESGSITVTTSDRGGDGSITWVQVVKSPSNVTRTKKVYVLGDSLVANYYGSYAEGTEVGGARTGWGQVLNNFFTDDVEVVNLANSGQYAAGLLVTAFPGVMAMGQEGDYFIIEAGYNDRTYSSRDEMYESVVAMVEQCEAKGIIPVLVSPNASAHDYKVGLQYASTMNDVAEDMQAKYDDVIFIDLAKLSYNFMMSTGISQTAAEAGTVFEVVKDGEGVLESVKVVEVAADDHVAMPEYGEATYYLWNGSMKPVTINSSTAEVTKTYNLTEVGGDTLHSSYAAATKWAEIVAQGMKDAGVDFVTTEYSYTFTDTVGNKITCQVD